MAGRPQAVPIYRRELQVCCEPLEERQRRLLTGLLDGKSLGAICEELTGAGEGNPPLADWFARWSAAGLITRLA